MLYIRRSVYVSYLPEAAQRVVGFDIPRTELGEASWKRIAKLPFRVVGADGAEISEPVWYVEISVWNGGTMPINRERIRRPLAFTFPAAHKLIDTQALHVEAKDGVEITRASDSREGVVVNWNYMDPGKGFQIAVAYTGATPGTVKWDDAYLDSDIIDANLPIFSRNTRRAFGALAFYAIVIGISFVALMATKTPKVRFLFFLSYCLITTGLTYWLVDAALRSGTPPF